MTLTQRTLALIALTFASIGAAAPQQAADPHLPTPTFDRGAPPALPADLRDGVLIFSKTNGWRHYDQIPRSNAVIARLAEKAGRRTYMTENAAIFTPSALRRFRVVVLNSASGDLFTPEQRAAFLAWLKAGGGLLAFHGAGGDPDQPWQVYAEEVIGARFTGHPGGADQFQQGLIRVERSDHPVMAGIPARWRWSDEFYAFDRVPTGHATEILATLDEASYRHPPEQAMGPVHPMIWTRRIGRGRVVFSALGHRPEYWDDPMLQRLVANALDWAGRR